jgi:hypothetical protein
MGAAGGYAGVPLAQTRGSEIERAAQQAQAHERQVRSQSQASDADGIAATDGEDNQPQERDADGRRLWERTAPPGEAEADEATAAAPESRAGLDGESGSQLDLSG